MRLLALGSETCTSPEYAKWIGRIGKLDLNHSRVRGCHGEMRKMFVKNHLKTLSKLFASEIQYIQDEGFHDTMAAATAIP